MHDLTRLIPAGVGSRIDLTLASSASSVARWTAAGDLVHVHPGVVMLPGLLEDPMARARAATLWAKGPLSHHSALVLWDAMPPQRGKLHVTVPADRYPRNTKGVAVHRTTLPMSMTTIRGIPVTTLARSLVDAWDWSNRSRKGVPHGGLPAVRQAVIECVRGRRISVAALRADSAAYRMHAGRPALPRAPRPRCGRVRERTGDLGRHPGAAGTATGTRSDPATCGTPGKWTLGPPGCRLPGGARRGGTGRRSLPRQPGSSGEGSSARQCARRTRLGRAAVQLRPADRRPRRVPTRDRGGGPAPAGDALNG